MPDQLPRTTEDGHVGAYELLLSVMALTPPGPLTRARRGARERPGTPK